ncbi:hypothetical protein AUQ44_00675 [Vibrio cidicii]|uniref:Uncharacterized protein n=1 Tax=Vibrio cidicii TaxID=1763883 RepID=A0A151JFY3_9VIBR|nr:hypothetical protein AUQ44_00675 [Vibrio cidicii]
MHFAREALKRIVVSSLFISVLAGYVAWTIAVESAEKETVNLAIEASYGAVEHFQLPVSNDAEFKQKGLQITNSLILDWFDIAELYDRSGKKIAESLTPTGHAIESALPHHVTPTNNTASYESLHLKSGEWILRTFVPLETNNQRWGYLEGVRVVPDWQRNDIRDFSLWVSVIAASFRLALCHHHLSPYPLPQQTECPLHCCNENSQYRYDVHDGESDHPQRLRYGRS